MTVNDLVFFSSFLLVTLLVYRIVPGRAKNGFLVLASLVFYAGEGWIGLAVIAGSIVVNYGFAVLISHSSNAPGIRPGKILLAVAILLDLALLGYCKYTTFTMPVGLSFYTLSVISCLMDVYRKRVQGAVGFADFTLYALFFPKVLAGPVVQWHDFKQQLRRHPVRRDDFYGGFHLFMLGLFKKALLADQLALTFSTIYGSQEMTVGMAWIALVGYGLRIYMDFSGYCDMAIGLARMFGFHFEPNFDHPYTAVNIRQFWRRFHISLGHWVRDYIYLPLGGNNAYPRNLLIVWLLIGLWHGVTVNYLLWGIFHFLMIMIDRYLLGEPLGRAPHVIQVLLTDLVVFVGWTFFFTPDVRSAGTFLGRLIGIGAAGIWSRATTFGVLENILLFAVSILCCSPLLATVHDRLVYSRVRRKAGVIISACLYIILFVFSLALITGPGEHAFIYSLF